MKLVPGNKTPDFVLKDTEGNDVSLSDIISDSNALILFSPLAYTGVCTKEMCFMRDNLSRFETLNAKVKNPVIYPILMRYVKLWHRLFLHSDVIHPI